MKKQEKRYYTNKYKCTLGKWKNINEETDHEDKSLLNVNIGTKNVTAPRELAEEYSISLINKINKIKSEMPGSTVIAEKVYKQLDKRNENKFELKEVSFAEVYSTLQKYKNSKARGNKELNTYILKQIPNLISICRTHLFNCMVRKSVFLKALKTSRVILLKKTKKPSNQLESF